jgi:TPP-dependent indolepyruvate ferredoxin oxidoreductase alpha subunit
LRLISGDVDGGVATRRVAAKCGAGLVAAYWFSPSSAVTNEMAHKNTHLMNRPDTLS